MPMHSTYSPGVIEAALPITVTSSKWPLTLTLSTQNPDSSLWKVTRSTEPVSLSVGASVLWAGGFMGIIGLFGG